MEFGIFNLMGAREQDKTAAQVFAEVAEQTRLADELGYTIAWFAEHHFSNYCLCASPLMMVAHCASVTKRIRLGTAVVVLPLYNPARLAAEIATADALSNGRLMLGIGAGYQPYEFERFGADIAQNLEMTDEFCDILDAFAAERAPLSRAHITLNRFAHITDSREAGMRFAENARYQTRLASSLRRRQEVMQGTVLVDVPFPDEPPLETIYHDLLIGDVETVAEKLVAEIGATKPMHVCFSFKVGNTPHTAAMRSMELMIGEVKPRVEKALGPLGGGSPS